MVLEGSRSSEEIMRVQIKRRHLKRRRKGKFKDDGGADCSYDIRRQTERRINTKYSFEHVKNSNVSSLFRTF